MGSAFGSERDGGGPRWTLPSKRSFSASAWQPQSWDVPAPGAISQCTSEESRVINKQGDATPPPTVDTQMSRESPT